MPATLDDLLTERTAEQETTSFMSVLQAAPNPFPVTDWEPGGVARTMAEATGSLIADQSKLVPTITKGGFPSLAKDLADPTWLDLLAEQFFDLTRVRATYTRQRIEVSCDVGFGPVDITPGFTVLADSGKRYIYQGATVSVPDGLSIIIEVQAESPGSEYRDRAGTIIDMVTPLPGLSVNNPETAFGGVTGNVAQRNPANRGSGAVLVGGTPTRRAFYTVKVTASGAEPTTGEIIVETEEDGVVTRHGPVSPINTYAIPGHGVTLTFDNGVGVGFVLGDQFTFQTPGTPIVANGVDDETNESLAKRCIGRWPSLSLNIVTEKYIAWIDQCSKDNAFGIEKITVSPSSTVAGQTDILVATATGAPAGSVITALQAYVNNRNGITDSAIVGGAIEQAIEPGGTVFVRFEDLEAAQATADAEWAKYIAELPIGGDRTTGLPGVVRLARLIDILMDCPGVIDLQGIELNGGAFNTELGPSDVEVINAGDEPSNALTWVPV